MNDQNTTHQPESERRIQAIEQRMVSIENRFKEENFLLKKEHRQLDAEHREIQAERLSLNIVARDLANLQKTTRQVYRRIILVLSLAAAIYAAGHTGRYIRLKHDEIALTSQNIETLSITRRFLGSMSSGELSVATAFAGAVAAVLGFFAIWLPAHIIKWLLIDFRSAVMTESTKTNVKQE